MSKQELLDQVKRYCKHNNICYADFLEEPKEDISTIRIEGSHSFFNKPNPEYEIVIKEPHKEFYPSWLLVAIHQALGELDVAEDFKVLAEIRMGENREKSSEPLPSEHRESKK